MYEHSSLIMQNMTFAPSAQFNLWRFQINIHPRFEVNLAQFLGFNTHQDDMSVWMRSNSTTLGAAALVVIVCVAPHNTALSDEQKFDPDTGYRISRYRAPVPETAPGGKRVDVADVERLISNNAVVLIDVMASLGLGPDKKTGKWRISKPRTNIPNSLWLPDVGEGKLAPDMEAYFKDNLRRATNGNKARAILIYCQADCWMSWNAVKRASQYGYTDIYWYPEGTDGWRDWDGKLVPASPVPLGSPSGSPPDFQQENE